MIEQNERRWMNPNDSTTVEGWRGKRGEARTTGIGGKVKERSFHDDLP